MDRAEIIKAAQELNAKELDAWKVKKVARLLKQKEQIEHDIDSIVAATHGPVTPY